MEGGALLNENQTPCKTNAQDILPTEKEAQESQKTIWDLKCPVMTLFLTRALVLTSLCNVSKFSIYGLLLHSEQTS